jgi:hypothetical protein
MAAYDPYLNNVSIENIVENLVQDCAFYFQLWHCIFSSKSHSVHFNAVVKEQYARLGDPVF